MSREPYFKDLLLYASPFAVWIALQTLLPQTAVSYAVRSAAAGAAGLACLWFARGRLRAPGVRAVAAGVAAGLAVAALWIFPDASDWYRTWMCWPIGSVPVRPERSPYDPAVCGWALSVAKLCGSAFVIAPAEELFFRSFLYRRLQSRDFTTVPLSRFDLSAFSWTLLLFTLEHDRLVAAAAAGAVYAVLAMRGGIGCAVAAHVATNLALGLHVVFRGAWEFW